MHSIGKPRNSSRLSLNLKWNTNVSVSCQRIQSGIYSMSKIIERKRERDQEMQEWQITHETNHAATHAIPANIRKVKPGNQATVFWYKRLIAALAIKVHKTSTNAIEANRAPEKQKKNVWKKYSIWF